MKNSGDYDEELQAMLDDLTSSKARLKGNPAWISKNSGFDSSGGEDILMGGRGLKTNPLKNSKHNASLK